MNSTPVKATLKELFKNGDDFTFGNVDYSSPEVSEEIQKVKEQQEKVLDEMKVDVEKMKRFKFDI